MVKLLLRLLTITIAQKNQVNESANNNCSVVLVTSDKTPDKRVLA